jgi:hypothetical protein
MDVVFCGDQIFVPNDVSRHVASISESMVSYLDVSWHFQITFQKANNVIVSANTNKEVIHLKAAVAC